MIMGQSRKHPLPNIGDTINDVIVRELIPIKGKDYKIVLECTVCHRVRTVPFTSLYIGHASLHKWCSKYHNLPKQCPKKFHKTWLSIRDRTTRVSNSCYERYGGRGISSDAFECFADFYDTMLESFMVACEKYGEENITIERIDYNGNYEPSNCCWIPYWEQAGNTSRNRYFKAVSPNGIEYIAKNQSKFSRDFNIPLSSIHCALREHCKAYGWSFSYLDSNISVTTIPLDSNSQ